MRKNWVAAEICALRELLFYSYSNGNCSLWFFYSRPASQDGDNEWRYLELIGVKQPVQVEVDNSDNDLPADQTTKK